ESELILLNTAAQRGEEHRSAEGNQSPPLSGEVLGPSRGRPPARPRERGTARLSPALEKPGSLCLRGRQAAGPAGAGSGGGPGPMRRQVAPVEMALGQNHLPQEGQQVLGSKGFCK
ncbi:hypothetical protein H1C71_035072, partial [Ictidomys tridecemlineatus]